SKTLHQINPKLITLHTTAYGFEGSKAFYSGWDPIMQPYCGHSIRGGGEEDPIWHISPIVDYATGAINAIAMLSGLLKRTKGQPGETLATNLLDTGIYLMSELIQAPDHTFVGVQSA